MFCFPISVSNLSVPSALLSNLCLLSLLLFIKMVKVFKSVKGKDTSNCLEKVMKISHLNQTNSAFYLYYDRTLLLFSRPMRVKDTSALREMFQHNSLVRASRPMPNSNTLKSFLLPRPELTKPCLMTYCP